MKDLYATLGVNKNATQDEVKRAYRKLTQEFHPDRNPGNKQAEDRFKEMSSAYEVLGDVDRRKLYDEFGEMSLTQGFDAERARTYRQASQGFGGYGGSRSGSAGGMPGGGFHFTDFGEARETSFDDLLSRLFGGGRVRVDDLGGMGQRRAVRRKGQDISGEIQVDLLDALAGTTVALRIEGQDGQTRTLDVKVPAGVEDGAKLRLRGQGGAGDPPGDIILTVHVGSHPQLRREGANLHLAVPVTALEAYRGGPIEIPTPSGGVVLKIPARSQNGLTLRLRGKGVAAKNKPAGDLLVTLDVRLPREESPELEQVLETLQGGENVRAGMQF